MIEKSTYELLVPVIAAIKKTVYIKTVVENSAGNYTITSSCTLWASVGFPITIGTEDYLIESIIPDESIVIAGSVIPEESSFELYAPKFYHGTIRSTEADLNAQTQDNLLAVDKLPMIWLHEPTPERFMNDPAKAIDRYSLCSFYFMCPANFEGWTNEQHYGLAIKPMRNLIDAFIDAIARSRTINDSLIEEFKVKDLPRFGRYSGQDGNKTVMFSSHQMSGSSLEVELPFIRGSEKCC